MRYSINFDKLINQLVPYYIGGRKLILYLQALMSPLRKLNADFSEYAKETRIEISMTSQIFKFEWYLNRKFQKYFADGGMITIKNSTAIGTPLYHEAASVYDSENALVRRKDEEGDTLILYKSDELPTENTVSFVVHTPKIDTGLITEAQYIAMLKSTINKYRLANKTYIIQYHNND